MARLQVEALKATYQQKIADNKSAEETLGYSQREYDRQKKLLGSGVASQSQFDQVANSLEVARQRVASTDQTSATCSRNWAAIRTSPSTSTRWCSAPRRSSIRSRST